MGNQDGVEQDKERERETRRMRIGKRSIGLLKSFLLLNNINKYTLKWGEKQPLDVPGSMFLSETRGGI
jgi:hypothetical protein